MRWALRVLAPGPAWNHGVLGPMMATVGAVPKAGASHQQSHRGAAGTSKSGGDGSRDRGSSAGPAKGTQHGCPTIHVGWNPRPRQG